MVISKLSIPHRSQLSSLHMCLHPRVCAFIRYKLKIDLSAGRNSSCYKNIASTGTRSRCWTRRCWIGGRNDWCPNAQAGSWFSSSSPGRIDMIICIGRENHCNGESSWTRYTWCILSVYIYTYIMAKQTNDTAPKGCDTSTYLSTLMASDLERYVSDNVLTVSIHVAQMPGYEPKFFL